MNEEIVQRVIQYLEGVQVYTRLLEKYFTRDEMDDFDQYYLDLYIDFEDFVHQQISNPDSPLIALTKHYQEFVVDYKDSLLFHCLEALNKGYERKQIYNEGKKFVYLRYLSEKYSINGRELLDQMDEERFEEFERNVFDELGIKKVIDEMT